MSFIVGQRWISESENDLGLGLISEVNHRTVTVSFPAAEEIQFMPSIMPRLCGVVSGGR